MIKNYFLAMVFVLIVVCNISFISALGITPARTTIDFSPNTQGTVTFSVLNSEHKDTNLVAYVQGDLNSSVALKENYVSLKAGEESKELSYSYSLPSDLSPGLHVAEIVVLQLPDKSQTSNAYVGAAVGVTTQLYVYVPYPGKFVVGELNIISSEANSDAVFVMTVLNKGNLDIIELKANIDIYTSLNEKVASFNTAEAGLKSSERKEIVSKWSANVPVGKYRAVANLIYDGQILQLEREFAIGSSVLELQQIDVNDFSLGEIAKLEMLVENKWSEPIKGAYSESEVFDSAGKVMAQFKSPTYDISPLAKSVMISYWDTGGVKEGTYDASVYLKYGQSSAKKDIKLKVTDSDIEVIGLGFVISESKIASKDNKTLIIILITVIGFLIMMNFAWFMYLRKYLVKKK